MERRRPLQYRNSSYSFCTPNGCIRVRQPTSDPSVQLACRSTPHLYFGVQISIRSAIVFAVLELSLRITHETNPTQLEVIIACACTGPDGPPYKSCWAA